jgi:hypothetical protein
LPPSLTLFVHSLHRLRIHCRFNHGLSRPFGGWICTAIAISEATAVTSTLPTSATFHVVSQIIANPFPHEHKGESTTQPSTGRLPSCILLPRRLCPVQTYSGERICHPSRLFIHISCGGEGYKHCISGDIEVFPCPFCPAEAGGKVCLKKHTSGYRPQCSNGGNKLAVSIQFGF